MYLPSNIVHNHLVEVRTFSDSNTSYMYAFIKYSTGIILPLFKYLKCDIPKSIMVAVDPFKAISPASMACSEIYIYI